MHYHAHGRVYKNKAIVPDEIDRIRCSVCGFEGVNANLDEGEVSLTRYSADTDEEGNPITSIHTARSQCPMCGSPRFRTGSAGDLKRRG